MFNEIKVGLARYLQGYYNTLTPTTKAMREYVARGYSKSVAIGPGRQVDNVEDMLSSYRQADHDDRPGTQAHLPVIIFALARDGIPATDWGRMRGDADYVMVPGDPAERVLRLRVAQEERRAQLAFFAADEPTAESLAAQFLLYVSAFENRYIPAVYLFGDGTGAFTFDFPSMVETPDLFTNHTPNEQKNLCILSVDMTIRCTVPLLNGLPAGTGDGKGTGADDPDGYPVTRHIQVQRIDQSFFHATQQSADAPVVEFVTPTPSNSDTPP